MADPIKTDIRGVIYASMSAAARQLGVSLSVIWNAVERGNTDNVGLHRKAGRPKKKDKT